MNNNQANGRYKKEIPEKKLVMNTKSSKEDAGKC